jgi:molybdopterin converting factor small subunit
MMETGQVTVEFYGVPRQRAGQAELTVEARSVGELLRAVEDRCPDLKGLLQSDGRLSPHYLLSIDGERFVASASEPIEAGTRVVLLSADPGG